MQLISHFRHLACVAALVAAGSASAHQVWIEQDAAGARLFFGEYGENLREVSPGLLDKFGKPQARKAGPAGKTGPSTDLTRTPTAFTIPLRAEKGESLVAEDAAYPMWDIKTGGRGMYVPAARLVTDLAPQDPVLALDLVPAAGSTADTAVLQAFFQGKPLPKAKVAVVTASGWAQEHHTDADGRFSVALPWSGTYVLEVAHEGPAGTRADGEKFVKASYVTSLTVVRQTGLAPLPAPPAARPGS